MSEEKKVSEKWNKCHVPSHQKEFIVDKQEKFPKQVVWTIPSWQGISAYNI